MFFNNINKKIKRKLREMSAGTERSNDIIITQSPKYIACLLDSILDENKAMLVEKEFSMDFKDTDKMVLLNTEISELADAVKKGLREDLEIADIIIRIAGIMASDQVSCRFKAITSVIKTNTSADAARSSISFTLPRYVSEDSYSNKMALISTMMIQWGVMMTRYSSIVDSNCSDADELIPFWVESSRMILMCITYYNIFGLRGCVEDALKEKMAMNWDRPKKYNTVNEIV